MISPFFSPNAWSLLINQKWYIFLSCNVSLLARHILWIDLEGKLLRAWTRQKQIFYAWKKEIFWAYESFFWKPLSQYFFLTAKRFEDQRWKRATHFKLTLTTNSKPSSTDIIRADHKNFFSWAFRLVQKHYVNINRIWCRFTGN